MRNFGRDNFYLEILEECSKEELNDREIYWIAKYDSYRNGYNGTEGGSLENTTKGEHNGRALLTEQDVTDIRTKYNEHIPFRFVYEKYKNKISKRGLQKVWHFENWPDILQEYNTPENKKWHNTKAKANPSKVARNNKRAFTPEQIREMRQLYANGMSKAQIWKTKYSQYAKSTIANVIDGKIYKDIV